MPRQARTEVPEEEARQPLEPEASAVESPREDAPRGGGGRGINQVTLVGRLARDPEVRMTAEGVARAWFVLAVPRAFAGRDGERDADFISIVAWRQLATVVGEHLTKGRLVGITGRLQVRQFEDGAAGWKTSAEVVADQVVFLDARRRGAAEE
ncbi:MAG: single-stranded DNA-binding protein [Armatimonadota bacterium]|nr:single-stranded DNA-binding protein [Armatimonadota bacterium]